jgi:signal transduction histidine kinase
VSHSDPFEAAWQAHTDARDRLTFVGNAYVAALTSPLWFALDVLVHPQGWWAFAPGRVLFAAALLALIRFTPRLSGERLLTAGVGAYWVGGIALAPTVPGAGAAYPMYVVSYGLLWWAASAVLALPLRWNAALGAGLLVPIAAAHAAIPTGQPPIALLLAGLYTVTAAGICAATIHQRFCDRRDAFAVQWQLEQRNHELAASRLEVIEERATRAAREAFLARMSHELRTPLNAILGYSALVRETADDAGLHDVTPDLDRIDDAGRHLSSLLGDILDLSALEAGQVPFAPADLRLCELATAVANDVTSAAHDKGLAVRVSTSQAPVHHDPARLRQVLTALISNAVKFTQRGEVAVHVAAAGDGYAVEVRDTGPGIPTADLDRIFNAFVQGDISSTRLHGGSGLGLAIARGLARRMGGDIAARSELGVGSTFTLSLPARHPLAGA